MRLPKLPPLPPWPILCLLLALLWPLGTLLARGHALAWLGDVAAVVLAVGLAQWTRRDRAE